MATFNPILQKLELKPLSASNPTPLPAPGRAIVLASKNQPMLVVRHGEGGAPTWGQIFLGRYNWFYEIDMTEQQLACDELLQSNDNITAFRASINITCCVRDPTLIVSNNVTDALLVIRPSIGEAMSNVAVRHSLEQLDQVRQEMRRINLAETAHSGFNIRRLSFSLSLTKEAEKIAAARAMHRLEHQNTMEQVRREDEIRDQKAIRAHRLIKEGPESLLADHLANNPNDTLTVAQILSKQRQRDRDLLRLAGDIKDPYVRDTLVETLTGKPAPQLTGGPDSEDEQLAFDPIVEDEDDVPDDFRRD